MITLGIHISAATFDRYLTGLDGFQTIDRQSAAASAPAIYS